MDTFSNKYDSEDKDIDPSTGLLRNKLGLKSQSELELAEERCLVDAYRIAASKFSEIHSFTEADICALHRIFMGTIYEWGGLYRTVDLGTEDIRWCHAKYINPEMRKYESYLTNLTPFTPYLKRKELLNRLARIHGELIVIHPFRDGNGRVTRLLCDLLLMQAEIEPFGQKLFDEEGIREEYFKAIREVWSQKKYEGLICFFDRLLHL